MGELDYAEKLTRGKKRLTRARTPDDLGCALLAIHGAMEDRLRFLLRDRVPADMQKDVQDPGKVTWFDLIIRSKQYLLLKDGEAQAMREANNHRQKFAHGEEFDWTREAVNTYKELVERWCADPKPVPLSKRGWVSLFARSLGLLLLLLAILWYGAQIWNVIDGDGTTDPQLFQPRSTAVPTGVAGATAAPARTRQKEAPAGQPCEVIWEPVAGEDLVNKTRATVWNETVKDRVEGSAMKPGDFYRLVVEKNPTLTADGYVFKAGTSYLLPRCR